MKSKRRGMAEERDDRTESKGLEGMIKAGRGKADDTYSI